MRRPPPPPIPLEEARAILAGAVPAPVRERLPLEASLGAILAADLVSDSDFPPFDRAMMDGFALRSSDAPGELRLLEEIPAGRLPDHPIVTGACSRIMTGAPVPRGADAVQQVEKTAPAGPDRVRILEGVAPGQNIAPAGSDLRRGMPVLDAGREIGPREIAVLAAIGRAEVEVWRRPRCAMLVTGDELVEPGERPGPGQIRNTNGWSVPAQVLRMGLACDRLGRARDRLEDLRPLVRQGLDRDVLILTGGVSAGEWDLVVPALEEAGVEHRMHQVLVKPGRPFFFGRRGRSVVFGLPGNPVSAFVTFEIFVRPFLRRMMGDPRPEKDPAKGRLAEPFLKAGDRVQFWPSRRGADGLVRLLPWKSSADLFTLARADGLAILPRHRNLDAGADVDVHPLD